MTSKMLVSQKTMIKLNFVTQVLKVIWCFGSKIVNIVYFVRFSLVFFLYLFCPKNPLKTKMHSTLPLITPIH